jgi:hypothetical protein
MGYEEAAGIRVKRETVSPLCVGSGRIVRTWDVCIHMVLRTLAWQKQFTQRREKGPLF